MSKTSKFLSTSPKNHVIQKKRTNKNKNKYSTRTIKNPSKYMSTKNFGMRKSLSQKSLVDKNIKFYNISDAEDNNIIKKSSIIDFQKKIKVIRKNSTFLPKFNSKKKKDNILSRINFNIQKTSQNLNNPDEFYSNYFNSILLGEFNSKKMNKISTNNISPHIYDKLKLKKDKAYIK